MKTVKALFVLMLLSNIVFLQTNQQTASLSNNRFTDPHDTVERDIDKPDHSLLHSRMAVTQLTDHLRKNVEYPLLMVNNCIEGKVIARVLISPQRKIEQYTIVKSPHSDLSEEVLKVLGKIEAIDIPQRYYEGKRTIFVPVQFKLH